MRYMVIERFKPNRAKDIYARFAEKGRMMPDGLRYLDSWVAGDLETCYQLMETDDEKLFSLWTRNWNDLAEFQIVPVLTSAEAKALVLAQP